MSMLSYVLSKYASETEEDMQKSANFMGTLSAGTSAMVPDMQKAFAGVVVHAGVFGLARIIDQIRNDVRRKALFEDLVETDPMLKHEDPSELMQYYATIYKVAPTLSLDKGLVRNILTTAVKFGTMDLQVIKTLSETEKNLGGQKPNGFSAIFQKR